MKASKKPLWVRVVSYVIVWAHVQVPLLAQLPSGESVSHGQAQFSRDDSSLVVSQDTDRLIVNWDSFSVGGGHQVRFDMPGSGSAALNRVLGGTQSMIDGVLSANGRLFLINPQGVVVGPGGVVRAHSFVGSTLDLSDSDFLGGGELHFAGGSGSVVNLGRIEALGGDVFLVGSSVSNSGTITAPGSVGLVAGSDVLIRPSGEERIFVSAGSETGVMVDHTGTIRADNAEFKSYGSAYTAAMNLSGVVEAGRISGDAGEGDAAVSGELSAVDGDGEIAVTAARVDVRETARMDARQEDGTGGRIRIGGGYQGMDDDLVNAEVVYVGEGALLNADGLDTGAGGEVIVWSDDTTRFYGDVSARGGELDASGGFVEVSGKQHLDFNGRVNLHGGGEGEAGTLLLDPTDLLVTGTQPDADVSAATPFEPAVPGGSSVLSYGTLQTALTGGDVTVRTINDAGTGAGDITFGVNATDDFAYTGGNETLTVESWNDLEVNADISMGTGFLVLDSGLSSTGGDLILKNGLTLTADRKIELSAGEVDDVNQDGTGQLIIPQGVTLETQRPLIYSGRVGGLRSDLTLVDTLSGSADELRHVPPMGLDTSLMDIEGFEHIKVNDDIAAVLGMIGGVELRANQIDVNASITASDMIRLVSSFYGGVDSAQNPDFETGVAQNNGAINVDPAVTLRADQFEFFSGMQAGVRADLTATLESYNPVSGGLAEFGDIRMRGFDLWDVDMDPAVTNFRSDSLLLRANDIKFDGNLDAISTESRLNLGAATYVPGGFESGEGWMDFRNITTVDALRLNTGSFRLISGIKPAADGGGRVSLLGIDYAPSGDLTTTNGLVQILGFSDMLVNKPIHTNSLMDIRVNQLEIAADLSSDNINIMSGAYSSDPLPPSVDPYELAYSPRNRTGSIEVTAPVVITGRLIDLRSSLRPGGGEMADLENATFQYPTSDNRFGTFRLLGFDQVDIPLLDFDGNPTYVAHTKETMRVNANSIDAEFDTYIRDEGKNFELDSARYQSLNPDDNWGLRFYNGGGQTETLDVTLDTQNVALVPGGRVDLRSSVGPSGQRENLNINVSTPSGSRPIKEFRLRGFEDLTITAADADQTLDFMRPAPLASSARIARTISVDVAGDVTLNGDFIVREATDNSGTPLGVTSQIRLIGDYIETVGDSMVATPQGVLQLISNNGMVVNTDVEELILDSGGAGDVIINERDSLFVTTFGQPTDTGNLAIAAQGDILIDDDVSRAGGDVFLLADAERSSIFGAGTGGADGTGAILGGLSNVGLLPNFERAFVADTDFTITYSGSIAGPVGTVVSEGDVFYGNLSSDDMSFGQFEAITSGGENVWAVRGYIVSSGIRLEEPVGLIPPTLLRDYASLGLGNDVTFDYGAGPVNFSPGTLAGDAPVDTSVPVDKFGDPTGTIGTDATLNMSGQWYTRPLADIVVSDDWVVRANTPSIESVDGDVVLSSGYQSELYETFAGSGVGAPADLFLRQNTNDAFETRTPDDFVYNSMRLNASAGNIFAAGFRDIIVQNANSLTADNNGEITLWAARDVRLEADAIASDLSTLNLIGGGVVTNRRADGTYATLNVPNLIATAGIAVDVEGEIDGVSGGLNDATYWADLTPAAIAELDLNGGLGTGFAHRDFVIRDLTDDLTVQTHLNQQYTRTDLDGDYRIVGYPSSSGVTWDGIETSGANNDGNVFLTSQVGDLYVNAQIDADVENATLNSAGAIRRSLGTDATTDDRISANLVDLNATTYIGSGDTQRILTDGTRVEFDATGDVWLSELNDVTLAGETQGASDIDFETEDGGGSTTLEQVRTGSGNIRVAAGAAPSGGNVLDGLAGELGSGSDDLSSASLNLATTGDLVLEAGGSIGGDGSSIDALEVHGATISATTLGNAAEEGVYLTVLDTVGGVQIAGPAVQVDSGRNIDLTARESTTGGTGSLSTAGAVTSDAGGYIRMAADRSIQIDHAITAGNASAVGAPGAGNIVLQSGLGGATGGLNVNAPVVSDMDGEINVLGLENVILDGPLTTPNGRVLAESQTGDLTGTGVITAANASLRASQGNIGSAGTALTANADQLVAESLQDQNLLTDGPTEFSSRSITNGGIALESTAGTITVGDVAVTSTLTPLTGGILPGATGLDSSAWSNGVRANGSGTVLLTSADDIILDQDVTSGSGSITATAANDILFNGSSQMVTAGDVTGTATAGAIIDNSGSATAVQIDADSAVLQAATGIGSGAMFANSNLGTDVNTLGATVAGTGDVNIYEVDDVTLADVSVNDGSFRLETGGLIDQQVGANFLVDGVGSEVELDTTRAALGHALISESGGNLNLVAADIAGDYIITSTGEVVMSGDHNIARDFIVGTDGFRLSGGDSIVGGEFQVTGDLTVDLGVLTLTVYGVSNVASEGGLNVVNELITEAGGVATITARFDDPDFDLAGILNQLPDNLDLSGVTEYVVNLRGETTTFTPAEFVDANAVELTNQAQNQIRNLVVRTGNETPGSTSSVTRDYNLVQSAAVDIGTDDLTVNAVRAVGEAAPGAPFTPGLTGGAGNSWTNGGNTFNENIGSLITLDQANTLGEIEVRDAADTLIREAGDVLLGLVNVFGDFVAESDSGDVTVTDGAQITANNGSGITYQSDNGNIVQATTDGLTQTTGLVVLDAAVDAGSAAQRIELDAGDLRFATGGDLYADEVVGDLNAAGTSGGETDILLSVADSELSVATVDGQPGIDSDGDVRLTADNMDLTEVVDATGQRVTLAQLSNSREITLGNEAPGTLSLTDAEIGQVTADTLQVGNTDSGDQTVVGIVDYNGDAINLALITGEDISTDGTGSLQGENLALTATDIDLFNGTDASNDGNLITGDLAIEAGGTTVDFKNGTDGSNGALNIGTVDGLAGIDATGADVYLNTSGLITQDAGADVDADSLELDTTRNTGIGNAVVTTDSGYSLQDSLVQGDFTLNADGDIVIDGVVVTVGDFNLDADSITVDSVGNIVGSDLNVVGAWTNNGDMTVLGDSTLSPSEVDLINAVLVINGTTAEIYAHGTNPDFDLASMIPEITALNPSIDTVEVNLRNSAFTQNTTQVNADAILLENTANTVGNELRVRTGGNVPTTLEETVSDYNLVQSAAIDTDDRDLDVLAARGSNHGTGGAAPFTPSPYGTSALNSGDGSYIELDQGNSFGEITVRDAQDTLIREAGDVELDLVNTYGDTTFQSDSGDVIVTDGAQITANDGSTITYQSDSGSIVQATTDGLTQTSGLVVLDAAVDAGSAAQRIELDAGDLRFATGGDLYADEVVGDLNAAGTSGGETDILLSVADSELSVATVDGQPGIDSNGDVRLTADNMDLTEVVDATGQRVTLAQLSNSREITLGNEAPGTLSLTDAEIGQVTADTLQVGNTDSGDQTVVGIVDYNGDATNLALITGEDISTDGTGSLQGENLALTATDIDLFNGTDASNDGNLITGDLAIEAGGTTVDFKNGTDGSNGALNIGTVDGLVGIEATGADVYLNTSGLITQDAGADVDADSLELDTTRNTGIGNAVVTTDSGYSLQDSLVQGDFTLNADGDIVIDGVVVTVGDFNLDADSITVDSVGNIVGSDLNVVGAWTNNGDMTVLGDSTLSPSEADLINAVLVINGTTAEIYAHGTNPDFDLASMIPEITALNPSIDTVEVNLRNDLYTQATTVVNADAILLENTANTVGNELRVRTGGNVPTTIDQTTRDYNLVQSAAIDANGRDLDVLAARGSNHGAGGAAPFTPSPYGMSALNSGDGSYIELDQGNSFGEITVRDAQDTLIREAGDVELDLVNTYGDTTFQSDSGDVIVTDGAQITANDGSTITYQSDSGSIVQATTDGLTQTSGLVVLDAAVDAGSAAQRIELDAGDLRFATGGDLYADEVVGDLNAAGTSGGETDILLSVADSELSVATVDGQPGIDSNGDVRLTADNMDLTEVVDATGQRVTLAQLSNSREITLGNEAPGTLSLTDAEIGQVTADTLQVGNTDSGDQTVVGIVDYNGDATNLALITGEDISTDGTGSLRGENLALTATDIDLFNGTDASNDGNLITGDLAIEAGGTTVDFKNGTDGSNGALNIGTVDGLVGIEATGADVYLNTSGLITQDAGADVDADSLELDTTRNTGIGNAVVTTDSGYSLQDSLVQGDFTLNADGDIVIDGVVVTVGDFNLDADSITVDSVGNIVGSDLNVVGAWTNNGDMTVLGDSTLSPSEVDLINAVLVINGTTAEIYAHGTNPDFDLASMIPEITALNPSIDTVEVNLRNDLYTQATTVVNADAILLENTANTVGNELRVRTGGNVPTTIDQTTSDYNLVQTAAIDASGRDLDVLAARGSNHGAGGAAPFTPSPYGMSALNSGDGSYIELDQGNSFGEITVRDAQDTLIREAGDVELDLVNTYGDTTFRSDSGEVTVTDGAQITANDGSTITYQSDSGSIVQATTDGLTQTSGLVVLDAAVDAGSAAQRIELDAGDLRFATGGDLYADEVVGDLNAAGTSGGETDILLSVADSELTVATVDGQPGIDSDGDVRLTADNMDLTEVVDATGQRVTLAQLSNSREITLGNEAPGTLSLTDAEIGQVTADTLQVGNTDSGDQTVVGIVDYNGDATNLALITGEDISTDGTGNLRGENLALTATDIDLFNGTDASNDGNLITGDLAIEAGGTTVDFKNGTDGSNGALNIGTVDGLVGIEATGADVYLNTSGLITQDAGADVDADSLELDTTRNTGIGNAVVTTDSGYSLQDSLVQGDFTLNADGDIVIDGVVVTVGDFNLDADSITVDSVGNIVGSDLNVVGAWTNNGDMTVLGDSTLSPSEVDLINAVLVINGTTAEIYAHGTNPDFDLASMIPEITALNPSIDTVEVNLRNDLHTQATTVVNADAILLENTANTVGNELRVRTGGNVPTTIDQTTRDYNLVQSAAIDTDGRDLIVNAATGQNHTAALSPFDNSLLNGGDGSTISLDDAGNQLPSVSIHDGFDTVLRNRDSLDIGESVVHGTLDVEIEKGDLALGENPDDTPASVQVSGESRFVAVGPDSDILIPGELGLGDDAIFAAGMDLTVAPGASVDGEGKVIMIVDENAGALPGDGWFRNRGTIEGDDGVIVYAVGGPAEPETHFPVQNQVELGNLSGLATQDPNLLDKYGVSYREGGGVHGPGFADVYLGSNGMAPLGDAIWYKLIPRRRPVPPEGPVVVEGPGRRIQFSSESLLLPRIFQVERYSDWAGEREFDWFYSIRTEPGEWMGFIERRYLRQRSFINRPASDSGKGDRPIKAVEDEVNPELAIGE